MEGSVCSCDGDTMQDELYSIHQSLTTVWQDYKPHMHHFT